MRVTQLFPILLTRDLPRLVAFYERTMHGDVVQEPQDMPWRERVAQVRGPDGNLVNPGAQPA